MPFRLTRYVCRRLAERSTRLAMLGTILTGAGSLAGSVSFPWNVILLAISVTHALMPDKDVKDQPCDAET